MVQASTTVTVAVVALSAASSAMGQDLFRFYRRAAEAATQDAPVLPGSHDTVPRVGTSAHHHDHNGALKEGASGGLPTKTVHAMARPTECKAGQAVSWPPKGKGRSTGSRKPSVDAEEAHHHHGETSSAPATADPSPTPHSLAAREEPRGDDLSPKPTPAPSHDSHHGQGHEYAGVDAHVHTVTHAGHDGKHTVYHILPATKTRCYAAGHKPTNLAALGRYDTNKKGGEHGAGREGHGAHEEAHGESSESRLKEQHGSQAHLEKTSSENSKLATRAIDILARFVNDMDRLD